MRREISRGDQERGSAAIEAVIIVPAFMLFVLLIIFGGRLAIARQAVEAAAADAARAASISRTQGQARSNGQSAAISSLSYQGLRCASQHITVDASGFASPAGTPAKITATVTCQVDLSDLSIPGVPGTKIISATMSSPIDTYRER